MTDAADTPIRTVPDEKRSKKPLHPVDAALSQFLSRLQDLKRSVRFAAELGGIGKAELRAEAAELERLARAVEHLDTRQYASAVVARLINHAHRMERMGKSRPDEALRQSLLLGILASYDGFVGDLLSALFTLQPEYVLKIGGKVDLVDALKADSISAIREQAVARFVDQFRRDSYIDQIERLEQVFSINTLRAFPNWPRFVESSQRRNVIAHCQGVPSPQYYSVCKTVGATAEHAKRLSDPYLNDTLELVREVGVKLAYTLWRKVASEQLAQADASLFELGYRALKGEDWGFAELVGEFLLAQRDHSSELLRRMAIINTCIARKRSGRPVDVFLSAHDWSACVPDFQLAIDVLRDEFAAAASLMRELGDGAELVEQDSYHTWPLFDSFRTTAEFRESYLAVFDVPYVEEIPHTAIAVAQALDEPPEDAG
jgi:hypothetical protein